MTKRKILLLAMSLCMVAILAVGGTLAYFTDTDAAQNVFTVGNIDIDLVEDFDEEEAQDILPGEVISKVVDVANTGSNPAYVRVHVAVPAVLDSGDEDQPQYAAYNNTLHWNFTSASLANWNWNVSVDGPNYPGNGGDWNCYSADIDGVTYNVYVATYMSELAAGATTENPAITQVYLDSALTQEQWNEIKSIFGSEEEIKVLVAAEAVQTVSFTDPYTALNTTFGVPGSYTVNWTPEAE